MLRRHRPGARVDHRPPNSTHLSPLPGLWNWFAHPPTAYAVGSVLPTLPQLKKERPAAADSGGSVRGQQNPPVAFRRGRAALSVLSRRAASANNEACTQADTLTKIGCMMTLIRTVVLALLFSLSLSPETQCADLPGSLVGEYATSSRSLDSFKKRVAEAKGAGVPGSQIGSYATSSHSLDVFKKRIAEAKGAGFPGYQIGLYAASSHSLDAFKKRVTEAKGADFPGYLIGAYATASHNLDAFKKRVAEAKGAEFPGYLIGAYAASSQSLDGFKKRVAEAE